MGLRHQRIFWQYFFDSMGAPDFNEARLRRIRRPRWPDGLARDLRAVGRDFRTSIKREAAAGCQTKKAAQT